MENHADIVAAHQKMIGEYQQVVADSMKQYEEMVAKAQADMMKLVQSASPNPPAPEVKPQAVWTRANDDEELLVLNKPAAEFISSLFDKVAVLAQELEKAVKGGKIRG